VSDAQLLTMLEKVNEQMPKTGITVRAPRCTAARIAADSLLTGTVCIRRSTAAGRTCLRTTRARPLAPPLGAGARICAAGRCRAGLRELRAVRFTLRHRRQRRRRTDSAACSVHATHAPGRRAGSCLCSRCLHSFKRGVGALERAPQPALQAARLSTYAAPTAQLIDAVALLPNPDR
jgi:hypothetical protein